MSPGKKVFGQFLGFALVVAALLLALGFLPTRRLGGEAALPAMFVGCAVGVVASLVGTIPVLLARNRPHVEAWTAAMVAMGVRLGIAIVLGVGLALSGIWPPKPLLVWVVLSHGGLMVPDTLLGIKVLARQALAEDR